MSKTLFLSDPHFGHKNIGRFRPPPGASSVIPGEQWESEEHDNFLVENIVDHCSKRDSLWILGDVCFSMDAFHHVERISKKVHRLNIVLGNHDLEGSKGPSIEDYLKLGNVKVFGMVKYKGFWLTHSPIHETELRGKLNIHGHIHSLNVDDLRYLNVCVEQLDYVPISFQDIQKEFRLRGVL